MSSFKSVTNSDLKLKLGNYDSVVGEISKLIAERIAENNNWDKLDAALNGTTDFNYVYDAIEDLMSTDLLYDLTDGVEYELRNMLNL